MTTNALRRDKLLGVAAFLSTLFCMSLVGILLIQVVMEGFSHINWQFLTESPTKGGRAGGIAPILVSTGLVVGLSLLTAVPVGLATALLLAEFTRNNNTFGYFVRKSLDVLAGVPSIVFGLFGNAFFCVYLGMGFSILSGGLTLACMVLPIFIRVAEESFRNVPPELRKGMAALGFSRTSMVLKIIIPVAAPGLVAGAILGLGRAIAETAALIFTSGYVDRMPESLLDSGRTLSIHIYDLAMNVPGGDRMAYASSLVLIAILIGVSFLATAFSRKIIQRGLTNL